MRRARTIAIVVLAVLGLGAGALLVRPGAGGTEVQAEFTDVHGLGLRGQEVRLLGAPAGSVSKLELTERGTVLMTMTLREGIPSPRRDAAAAIRPLDIFGDFYVSLSPGGDPEPLEGAIPVSRTVNRPQLDDVLRAFGPPVRGGLQALIVELGTGLERRGVDLNRAAVELRPALAATDALVRELASQRAGLRTLVGDAERTTGQLARRDRDLRRLVDGLAGALGATARRELDLDRGLAGLPATLERLEGTAGRLERTAAAARPIAALTGEAAPDLATALERAPSFLSEAERTAGELRPALRRTADLLGPLSPVADDLARSLPILTDFGPDLARLVDAAADAAPDTAQGLLVQLPEAASEPGRQPFDPSADPRRRFLRVENVLSCESFGRRIRPGCLDGIGSGGVVAEGMERRSAPARGSKPSPRRADEISSFEGGRSPSPKRAPDDPADEAVLDFLLGP